MSRQILSIDVGIKNLSFCLFEINILELVEKSIKVLKWDNIDLTKQDDIGSKCMFINDGSLKTKSKTKTKTKTKTTIKPLLLNDICNKPAKFIKDSKCYCLKHSKLTNFLQPSADLKHSFLNKQKIANLIEIANKYKILTETDQEQNYKKVKLIELINDFSNKNCFSVVEKGNASKVDLVTIGRNIQHRFDDILSDYLLTIDTIIIENQIGPIANKMKTIQGMLAQYFIMKNNNISIDFISASNKLKDFMTLALTLDKVNDKMDYKQRKKLGIQICSNFVDTDQKFNEWATFFSKHQKKDDLSDCFLQGMWYIKHKI
jgi:hypothetical protein